MGCNRLFTRQGPQDKGGLLLVIAVKAAGDQLEQNVTRTIAVIEARCNQLGIYCKLQRDGGGQLTLRVSGGLTPERVKNTLLSQGLELRAVDSRLNPAPLDSYATRGEAEAAASADKDVLPYNEAEAGNSVNNKKFIVVERTPVVTGEDIRDAHSSQVLNNYEVVFSLRPEGAAKLQAWTRANINKYIAVVLNKEARSVAYIRSEISDSGVITGRYTKEQAEDIAQVLKTGNLPAPVEILRESTYKP
jgi:preprotein translocase subunit SecD